MNIGELRDYLQIFSKEGYAKDPGTRNADGSKTIRHTTEDSKWSTTDTYWGGEPYAGCETVSFEKKPCWSMVYYGTVDSNVKDIENVYRLLRSALDNTDPSFPVRGPKTFNKGNMTYTNHWNGTLEQFDGIERILKNGKEIYNATYFGGVVNQRED